jgi:hypothetical protein
VTAGERLHSVLRHGGVLLGCGHLAIGHGCGCLLGWLWAGVLQRAKQVLTSVVCHSAFLVCQTVEHVVACAGVSLGAMVLCKAHIASCPACKQLQTSCHQHCVRKMAVGRCQLPQENGY